MNQGQPAKRNTPPPYFSLAGLGINVLSKLLAIPLFILLYRILPYIPAPFYLDKIILFFGVSLALFFILRYLRYTILLLSVASLAFLSIGSFVGPYGFKDLYLDYEAMVYSIIYDPIPVPLTIKPLQFFPNQRALKRAVNYTHRDVRQFALKAVNTHFKEYQQNSAFRKQIQALAVFKAINQSWNYVNDPRSRDYFALASESVRFLSGDCDDHSTCMAACIKSIGGRVRLILTTRHLYPELYVGSKNDFDRLHVLIREVLFKTESEGKPLHYHIDAKRQIWINLDYTAKYPGGPFMAEPVLGVLDLD
ncbi:MAG: hypothetical protein JNM44_12010 [Chitinophagaceae bacterium]|nr:hypothetical protein [Chitinophagaceae bacterium]